VFTQDIYTGEYYSGCGFAEWSVGEAYGHHIC